MIRSSADTVASQEKDHKNDGAALLPGDALASPATTEALPKIEKVRAALDRAITNQIAASVTETLGSLDGIDPDLAMLRGLTDQRETLIDALIAAVRDESELTITRMVDVLKGACDRTWTDETPWQVANIAANAIYWRTREIEVLRGGSGNQPAPGHSEHPRRSAAQK